MSKKPEFKNGQRVLYQGRLYTVASTKLDNIGGPHYRLTAAGSYPGEDLTSEQLVRPAPKSFWHPAPPGLPAGRGCTAITPVEEGEPC